MSGQNEPPKRDGAPEPPERWKPDSSYRVQNEAPSADVNEQETIEGMMGSTRIELTGAEIPAFESARRLITVSQIMAIVSFFIGGVLLSAAAVACALLAFRKLAIIAAGKESYPDMQRALMKVGTMALGLAAFALVANIVALVFLYPMAMDALQSGSLSTLFGGSASTGGGVGNSTWG